MLHPLRRQSCHPSAVSWWRMSDNNVWMPEIPSGNEANDEVIGMVVRMWPKNHLSCSFLSSVFIIFYFPLSRRVSNFTLCFYTLAVAYSLDRCCTYIRPLSPRISPVACCRYYLLTNLRFLSAGQMTSSLDTVFCAVTRMKYYGWKSFENFIPVVKILIRFITFSSVEDAASWNPITKGCRDEEIFAICLYFTAEAFYILQNNPTPWSWTRRHVIELEVLVQILVLSMKVVTVSPLTLEYKLCTTQSP